MESKPESNPNPFASQALSAVEESRREMLREGARTLLDWNLPVEAIMEITKLSKKDIEELRAPKAGAGAASQK
jgi:hypothetical protein